MSFKKISSNFIICGLCGWCLECFWTGLHSVRSKDKRLTCRTSFWMFPIYGAASVIAPLSTLFSAFPTAIRGTIYACGIYAAEYGSGSILKKINACPWDYSKARYNYKGIIRLDYAPVWFLVGLLYEKILNRP